MRKIAIITILFALLAATALPVSAVDLKTAKSQKSNIDSRISELNANKKKVLEEKAKLEKQQKQVANAQATEGNAYQELVSQISDAEENLKQTEDALAQAQTNYNQQLELVKLRLNVMYQNSGVSMIESLLASSSFLELFEKIQYIGVVEKQDSQLMDDLKADKLDVEYKKKLQQQAKDLLEQKANEKQARLTTLKSSRAALADQLDRSKSELAKLNQEEDNLIAESQRLSSVIKSLTKSSGKYAGGTMVWPVPSSHNITSTFGMRKHPILRTYKMHTGIDIAASYGSSIVAANKGKVIIAGYDSNGYGNYVVIDHGGGITTLYGHCSKLLVKVGDEVKAGEVIAKIGSTGLSTGNHCHFEVRKDGVLKNPLSGYVS